VSAPRATYRLQLGAELGLIGAAELAEYLADLGVSHVYTSPILQAAEGSAHGYDVVDPTRVSRALGGESAFRELLDALRKQGLALLLDLVPNHMATSSPENRWWWDMLENGPASQSAAFFDVDWRAAERKLAHRILLPILATHYGRALAAGELRLALAQDQGGFVLHAGARTLPIAPRSIDALLRAAASAAECSELEFLAHAHGSLPLASAADAEAARRRHRHKEVLRGQLARLVQGTPRVAAALKATVACWNGDPELLHALLERQNYRLAHWRTAAHELGYRRFFDVAGLIGLRVEEPRVREETHAFVLARVRAGEIDGLRIDHVDGLRDPLGYLEWLAESAPNGWLLVEKILSPGETLPGNWPVAGTTGYDFLWRSTGVLIDPAGEAPLSSLYGELTGDRRTWAQAATEGKRRALRDLLASDLARLTDLAVETCERRRDFRDLTSVELRRGLTELIVAWPVYRTYLRAGEESLGAADAAVVQRALAVAADRAAELDPEVFALLGAVLRGELRGPTETELALRLQQLTGAVMAKGVEDTASYGYPRLAALCDVGGDPGAFGVSPQEFHSASAQLQANWPESLLATSTHDAKLSGDVRARLALLSEIPAHWAEVVWRWFTRNARHRFGGGPDAKLEYLLYQVLVGSWPLCVERCKAYALKAAREAKEHTSWLAPVDRFEAAVTGFVERLYADEEFTRELETFVAELVEPGRVNSLAMLALKLTSPGVPDLYQGSELWDGSLVDPDNRRPIDFALRRRLLAAARRADVTDLAAAGDTGLPKLWLIARALRARAQHPERFDARSHYRPLFAFGPAETSVLAFARRGLVCAVPRLRLGVRNWRETALELPPGRYRDAFSGEVVEGGVSPVAALWRRFPVALLLAEGEAE
jgi:(1->4)-alpha-D-glucan 1-alpha-D-glucosylmutase